jgi:hypothetical protein
MHMHPETYITLLDQDRERWMTQRALERAARSGGQQHPETARGGISGLASAIRRFASAAIRLGSPEPRGTSSLGGATGA